MPERLVCGFCGAPVERQYRFCPNCLQFLFPGSFKPAHDPEAPRSTSDGRASRRWVDRLPAIVLAVGLLLSSLAAADAATVLLASHARPGPTGSGAIQGSSPSVSGAPRASIAAAGAKGSGSPSTQCLKAGGAGGGQSRDAGTGGKEKSGGSKGNGGTRGQACPSPSPRGGHDTSSAPSPGQGRSAPTGKGQPAP